MSYQLKLLVISTRLLKRWINGDHACYGVTWIKPFLLMVIKRLSMNELGKTVVSSATVPVIAG